jgi:hypothetical protein
MRQKIAVVAAMIHGILFCLYGNCRDKIQALVHTILLFYSVQCQTNVRHFWVTRERSRQFKQREKRLLKVVTVNLPLYKQLYSTKKSRFVVRRLSNVGEVVPQKWRKNRP